MSSIPVFIFSLTVLLVVPVSFGAIGVSPSVITSLPATLHVVNAQEDVSIIVETELDVYPTSLRLNSYERGQFYVEGNGDVIELIVGEGDVRTSLLIPVMAEKISDEKGFSGMLVILLINVVALFGGVYMWMKKRS